MTRDTNTQVTVGSVIAENRNHATLQSFLVMSVALVATTLICVTSLATMFV